MMRPRILRIASALLLAVSAVLAEPGAVARAEIDSLLAFVRGQKDAVFVRNGATHDAREAEAHLRLKWSHQEDKIRSAEDFIDRCASKSILTGRPYRMRFKDGSVRETREVLLEELTRIRSARARP